MSKIMLDFGSGNTCKNDRTIVKRMYDDLKAVDTGKHEIITKWQLFEKAGANIPLMPDVFEYAYEYGSMLGYKVTSSVFDVESLAFLLDFNPCLVKIANNRKLDYLIGEIPRKIPVVVSVGSFSEYSTTFKGQNIHHLLCVSQYPTDLNAYETKFLGLLNCVKTDYGITGISDHTTNWDLLNKYKPQMLECHYKLEDSTGLDAGPFARTPKQLSEVL
jgi:sialic acid synthase SpsE